MSTYRITVSTESKTKPKVFIVNDDNFNVLVDWLRDWKSGSMNSIRIDKIEDEISNFNIILEMNTWIRQLDKGAFVPDVLMAMDKKLTEWMQVANSRRKRRCLDEQVINPCTQDETVPNAVRSVFRHLHKEQ